MENFSITTRLTTKGYAKFLLLEVYRKPVNIACGIFGAYFIVTVVLDRSGIISFYPGRPYFEIFVGLLLLLLPALKAIPAFNRVKSNPTFQHNITYTFGEEGVEIQDPEGRGVHKWADYWGRKEVSKFLILWHDERSGSFIDKTKLTSNQLKFIKSKVAGT